MNVARQLNARSSVAGEKQRGGGRSSMAGEKQRGGGEAAWRRVMHLLPSVAEAERMSADMAFDCSMVCKWVKCCIKQVANKRMVCESHGEIKTAIEHHTLSPEQCKKKP
jgi:hypothetical protein